MGDTLVVVTFPYDLEYRRWCHQTKELKPFWYDHRLLIATVTGDEAPVACHVIKDPFAHEFPIRCYDQRLWWPLLERSAPVSVENYLDRARETYGPFLSMMNLSDATLRHPRRYDRQAFIDRILPSWMSDKFLERRRQLADEIAHRTLFCDGAVYLAGGSPAYFGRWKDGQLRLESGSLGAEKVGAIYRFLPGPDWRQREEAACQGLVFRPAEVETLIQTGLKVHLLSKLEGILELPSVPHPAEVCADAVVRRAISQMEDDLVRMPPELLKKLREAILRRNMIPPKLCWEAIEALGRFCPHDNVVFELHKALVRLLRETDLAKNSPEDDLALQFFGEEERRTTTTQDPTVETADNPRRKSRGSVASLRAPGPDATASQRRNRWGADLAGRLFRHRRVGLQAGRWDAVRTSPIRQVQFAPFRP